uniref:MD-2-related lipid-recognition domain-containing protein n=1 Tax=Megaselia scalaris TaxID=36166 RepID=T1GAN3_MEGSC
MKSCPVKKGIFYIHDYRIDEEMLPSYVPEANFRVILELTLPNKGNLANVTINGYIDKSKGFNNLKMFNEIFFLCKTYECGFLVWVWWILSNVLLSFW